ncbi:MAG: HAD family hydrolase [Candidatus Acetothermia bacterium]|nr:HAD family hydrolase [Candidatus Acetothermia bacterium]
MNGSRTNVVHAVCFDWGGTVMRELPGMVRQALARVHLDRYLDVVVTARDLGAAKPDPAFFHAVLARLNCPPAEAAMVGDG